ncbi:hypothetical protein [Streptomyces sp. NPDC002692]
MENERGATKNEQTIQGYRYVCDHCQGCGEPRDSAEAVTADAKAHRQQQHGGLAPINGDRYEEVAIRRQVAAPAAGSSSSGGATFVIIATLAIVVIVGIYLARH